MAQRDVKRQDPNYLIGVQRDVCICHRLDLDIFALVLYY